MDTATPPVTDTATDTPTSKPKKPFFGWTVKYVAEEKLNISVGMVYKLIHSGQLKALRFGRTYRITFEQLQDYFNNVAIEQAPAIEQPYQFKHLKLAE